MKLLLLFALIMPLPAQAKDLWCMPSKICVPGSCDFQIDEGASIRLTNLKSAAPSLHTRKETIAMSKIFEHLGLSKWKGVNSVGETEVLSFDRERMWFIYSIRADAFRYKASGLCEVR